MAAVLFVALGTREGIAVGQPERHPQRVVLEGMPAIRPGDLVFRRGDSLASAAVLTVDPGRYSHVGMVVQSPQGLAVVHAAPADDPAEVRLVASERLDVYLAPAAASAAAIYRSQDAAIAEAAAAVAAEYHRRGLRFDAAFSLQSEDELYCTELVWRAFREQGTDLLDAPPRRIKNLVFQGPLILPSDLLGSSRLQLLHVFPTKEKEDVPR